MTLTASVTASLNVGSVSYTWTINQTSGTTFAGVSTTTGSNTATITYPNTLTWAGAGASSGTYAYTLQVIASDGGVGSCNQIRTYVLFFTDTPPSCTLSLSLITVS